MDRTPTRAMARTATLGTRVALAALAVAAAAGAADALHIQVRADAAAAAAAGEAAGLRRELDALRAAPARVVTERLPCPAPATRATPLRRPSRPRAVERRADGGD